MEGMGRFLRGRPRKRRAAKNPGHNPGPTLLQSPVFWSWNNLHACCIFHTNVSEEGYEGQSQEVQELLNPMDQRPGRALFASPASQALKCAYALHTLPIHCATGGLRGGSRKRCRSCSTPWTKDPAVPFLQALLLWP